MWSSPLFWIVFSIAIFWALGAYNRLMRLRSAVVQAFGSLDAHIVRQVALLGEFGAAHPAHAAMPGQGALQQQQLLPPQLQELAALQGATTQLSASLAVARARPLQANAIAALAAAREVLQASWTKALHAIQATPAAATQEMVPGSSAVSEADSSGAAAPASPLPAALWQARWEEHVQQNDHAIRVFNEAVVHYNGAVAQFPANLLAWVFGFKAARAL